MTSKAEVVIFEGRLIGMGLHVDCMVSVRKVPVPGTKAFDFMRPMIHGEPKDLPDGEYQVIFAEGTIPIQRHLGAWIAPTSVK